MKKNILGFMFLSLLILGSMSCKSEFEKVRASGDVKMLLKTSLAYYDKGDWQKSQTLFELIMPSLKGQPSLEEVSYKYAYTHFNLRSYLSASFYFKNFAQTFGNSPYREDAEYMSAFSEYKQSPNFRLDQDNTAKAIEGFQNFVNNFPESKRVKECNKLMDELRKKLEKKAFEEGVLYYNMAQYQSATQVFENLLKDFPESADAEEVRFLILKGNFLLAENSIVEKQLERFRAVVDKYNDFTAKFPKSKFSRDAESYLKTANNKIKELNNVRYQIQSAKS